MAAFGTFRRVAQSKLGVSEPPPRMFGNRENEPRNPSWTNGNWLKSRFHFSFAEYHNMNNQNFGVLRVMNDDLVQPMRGFGTHGHRDAEICTYVVNGALTHADSMGTDETITDGAIQFMTAGSGVSHSEHNKSALPLRFIQMWLTPRSRGLPPNYGSSAGSKAARTNAWHHMVSDVRNTAVATEIKINVDANIFVAELEKGATDLELQVAAGRQAYLLVIDGVTAVTDQHDGAVCSGVSLERHDAAEIVGPVGVTFSGPTHLLVVEMAHDPRSDGRGDL
jgi:redox-sensitive bicupin YhaK (pirin superfamily)